MCTFFIKANYYVIFAAPTGVPTSLSLLQPINNLTWNEVNCIERNGLITGYTVMISNSSITYSLTSIKRYIILNDLVLGTVYIISVAAVNSAGRGPFSDPIALLLQPLQLSQSPAASGYIQYKCYGVLYYFNSVSKCYITHIYQYIN